MLDDGHTVIYQLNGEDYRQLVHRDDLRSILEDGGFSMDDVEVFPLSEATADELSIHIGNLLEDANYHSLGNIPDKVLEGLREARFSEEQMVRVMDILGDALTSAI